TICCCRKGPHPCLCAAPSPFTSPRNGLKPLEPMPQIRPQRRLVRGRKRYPNPNRIRRLVVAIRQVHRRLPCPRLAVVVQGVVNLHLLVGVQTRQLHLAVGALEVIAVDVQLPLHRTTSTRAFVSVGRAQRRAYVVSNET